MAGSPITHYLQRFSEHDSAQLAATVEEDYDHVLVVPAYDEPVDFLHHVLGTTAPDRLLTIIIANVPDDAPAARRQNTLSLLKHCQRLPDVLCVDRVDPPIPARQGVGLARKLGTDIAAHLIEAGRVLRPWIYHTDADAQLPGNYFDLPSATSGGLVFGHRHVSSDPQLQFAARLYEAHMAWYWRNLAALGSRYAYPSLGSTMAIHCESYCAVRGYPKRNAGEDFYLLNKIAKVAEVRVEHAVTVTLQARQSSRVPFGTGPALAKINQLLGDDPSGISYRSYHPEAFALLGRAIAHLQDISEGRFPAQDRALVLLEELGLHKVLNNILQQYPHARQRQDAFENWFDALKTLRFVHLARRHHADVSLIESLQQSAFAERNEISVPIPT